MNVEQSRKSINSSQNEFFLSVYSERIVLGWADILTGFAISGALHSDEIKLTLVSLACFLILATVESSATDYLGIEELNQIKDRNSIATGIILSCLTLLKKSRKEGRPRADVRRKVF